MMVLTQVRELLVKVVGQIRVIENPCRGADGKLLVSISEPESQEIIDQIFQRCTGQVNGCACPENTAYWTLRIWGPWTIRCDHSRRQRLREG